LFQNRQQCKEPFFREAKKGDEKNKQNNCVGLQEAEKVDKA